MVRNIEQKRPEERPDGAENDKEETPVDKRAEEVRAKKDRVITAGSNFLSPPYSDY